MPCVRVHLCIFVIRSTVSSGSELAGGGEDDLGEGGVAVDGSGQTVDGDVGIHRHHHLLDEVGGVRSTDVAAHNLARVGIDNHLQQAIGLGHGDGFAVAAEEGFLHYHIHAALGALLLGESHHR